MKTTEPVDLSLCHPDAARNFRPGLRLNWGDSSGGGGLLVVSEVDVEKGVVTVRDPTRLERIVWWLGKPLRWVCRRWLLWRYG